jgi:hypothetical protein
MMFTYEKLIYNQLKINKQHVKSLKLAKITSFNDLVVPLFYEKLYFPY